MSSDGACNVIGALFLNESLDGAGVRVVRDVVDLAARERAGNQDVAVDREATRGLVKIILVAASSVMP